MPTIVECPSCHRKLRLPDHLLAKKVRCPGCKHAFAPAGELVPEPKPAPPPPAPRSAPRKPAPRPKEEEIEELPLDEEEEEPERSRRPARSIRSENGMTGWRRVRLGITLVLVGVFVLILAILDGAMEGLVAGGTRTSSSGTTVVSGTTVTVRQTSTGPGLAAVLFAILAYGLMFVSRGFTITGYSFCLMVPESSGARSLAVGSFALGIANVIFPIITVVVSALVLGATIAATLRGSGEAGLLAGAGIVVLILYILTLGLFVCEIIAFFQFLRLIASHLGARGLARSISFLLLLLMAILVLAVLAVLILMLAGSVSSSQSWSAALIALAGCGCTEGVLFLGWLVWSVVTLFLVRGTLSRHIGE